MTKEKQEEILKKAKIDYPTGTIFKCLHNCSGGPIKENSHRVDTTCVRVDTENGGCGCIYEEVGDVKWAEIISKPEQFKTGDILYHDTGSYIYIIVFDRKEDKRILGKEHICINANNFYKSYLNTTTKELREASFEEEKWLLACIKANKFIPKEEALKPVIMEKENLVGRYLKIIRNPYASHEHTSPGDYLLVTSETVLNINTINVKTGGTDHWIKTRIVGYEDGNNFELMPISWTPETKTPMTTRAIYSELTSLPDKWCIIAKESYRLEFLNLLKKILPKTYLSFDYEGKYYHFNKEGYTTHLATVKSDHTEITFDQFKKWVLVENKPKEESFPKYVIRWGEYGANNSTHPENKGGYPEKDEVVKVLKYDPKIAYGDRGSYIREKGSYICEKGYVLYAALVKESTESAYLAQNKRTFKSRVRWKVGEKIRFIHETTTYYTEDGIEKSTSDNKGRVFEVGEFSTKHPDLFRFTCDRDIWYMENDFEPEFKSEVKMADKQVSDDWCVKVTDENRENVRTWMDDKNKIYSTGAYYGKKNGAKMAHYDESWGKLLSTEEFYQKIGKSPSPPKEVYEWHEPINTTFKVGDWVVITTLDSNSKGKMQGKVGHVYKIDKIDSNGFYIATKETYITGSCWPKDCLRKALSHEIPVENFERRSAIVEITSLKEPLYTPSVKIDSDVFNLKMPKSASVTLKNTEREVKINVKQKQSIQLNK